MVSYVALWLVVLLLGLLLLGTLRALGLLRWRLEQLKATTPVDFQVEPDQDVWVAVKPGSLRLLPNSGPA